MFIQSGSQIVTENRELAQGLASSWLTHTYARTHTHMLQYITDPRLTVCQYTSGKSRVSHTVNMDFTFSFLTFTPS